MFTQEELYELNYITQNVKNERFYINKDRVRNSGPEVIEEILESLKEFCSEDNYIQIIHSLIDSGIPVKNTEIKTDIKDGSITTTKSYNGSVVDTLSVKYEYICSNDFQKEIQDTKYAISKLDEKIKALANTNQITIDNLESLARQFIKTRNTEDVYIGAIKTKGSYSEEWAFNKEGFVSKKESTDGVLSFTEEKLQSGVRKTVSYNNGLPALETIKDLTQNMPSVSETEYTHKEGKLTKKKTVNYVDTQNTKNVTSYIYRLYDDAEKLHKIQIKDIKFGTKTYIINPTSIIMTSDNADSDIAVELPFSAKEYAPGEDILKSLKEIDVLEGCLLQLQKYVPEISVSYNTIIANIYNSKLVLGLDAIKKDLVVIYIADMGNTTLYEKNGTKLAYYPRNILGNFYKNIMENSNTIVEQSIKSGKNPDQIKMLYWLGSQEGAGKGIYAFNRVLKALVKNSATPTEVLDSIVDKIIAGKYSPSLYLNIVQHKNATTKLLSKVLDSNPDISIKELIEKHPNRPTTKKEEKLSGESLINSILK